jgi:hypothetical protein
MLLFLSIIAQVSAGPLLEAATGGPPVALAAKDPFEWEIDPLVLQPGSSGRLVLRLVIPPDMHVYRDALTVEVIDAAGLLLGAADLPPGERMVDPADGSDVREMYRLSPVIYLPVSVPADKSGLFQLVLRIRHQGCRPGLCFPPHEAEITAIVAVEPS